MFFFVDPLGKPLVARGKYRCQAIDPMVFVDDDGSAWLYFGQGNCNVVKLNDFVPALVNDYLFRRDQFLCMYCGGEFAAAQLSRDHILPVSRNGTDGWTNVVTACKRCNHRKANRTPEEAGMELLAIPFVPNRYEFFYLANKNILADQMDFLKSQFSRNGTWL